MKSPATLLLKLATTLCYLSSAWQFYRFSNTFFSYLYIDHGVSAETCEVIVIIMIAALVASSIAIWINSLWAICFSFTGALAVALNGYAGTVYPPEFSSVFTFVCYALRYLLPLAILLLFIGKKKQAHWVLVFGLALTFAGHGAKALFGEITFLDYLMAFFYDLGLPISLATAIMLLHIIGTIDVVVSHHILFFRIQRIKWVLVYMVFWGLISAGARVTFGGWGSWHEVTIRAQHYLVPLAILLMAMKEKTSVKEPLS